MTDLLWHQNYWEIWLVLSGIQILLLYTHMSEERCCSVVNFRWYSFEEKKHFISHICKSSSGKNSSMNPYRHSAVSKLYFTVMGMLEMSTRLIDSNSVIRKWERIQMDHYNRFPLYLLHKPGLSHLSFTFLV